MVRRGGVGESSGFEAGILKQGCKVKGLGCRKNEAGMQGDREARNGGPACGQKQDRNVGHTYGRQLRLDRLPPELKLFFAGRCLFVGLKSHASTRLILEGELVAGGGVGGGVALAGVDDHLLHFPLFIREHELVAFVVEDFDFQFVIFAVLGRAG